MSSNVQKSRPSWVLPVIGFLIGMLIGWWVIGWGIWPVQWTNALPPDLRAAERDEYLTMVAESYAASRNADVAKGRLSTWSPQALSQDLSEPTNAGRVQSTAGGEGAGAFPVGRSGQLDCARRAGSGQGCSSGGSARDGAILQRQGRIRSRRCALSARSCCGCSCLG